MLIIPVTYNPGLFGAKVSDLFLITVGNEMYYPCKNGFKRCIGGLVPEGFSVVSIPEEIKFKEKRVIYTTIINLILSPDTYIKDGGCANSSEVCKRLLSHFIRKEES